MRNLLSSWAIVALGLASSVPAAAQQSGDEWNVPQPAWEGVWQGTIGNLPVHVCLDKTPYEQKGAYYYDRTKRLIRLRAGAGDGSWAEGEENDGNAPSWQIGGKEGELAGTWRQGSKRLPIALHRIGGPSKDFEGPCGSMTFFRARTAPPRIISRAGVFDGARIATLTFKPPPWFEGVAIGTFTLDRAGSAAAAINAELRKVLPRPDGTGEWLDCMAESSNANGSDGEYGTELTPRMISRRWLVIVDHWDGYCGGAHPDSSSTPRIFDMSSGREINLFDWFNAKAVKRERVEGEKEEIVTIVPAFRSFVIGRWKAPDADCSTSVREEEFWNVELTRSGFLFTPVLGHAAMACARDFEVPFARVSPYLSPEGAREVAAFRAITPARAEGAGRP